jgi:microcystin-dependent protein
MPNNFFQDGDIFEAEDANALANPRIDGGSSIGSIPLITDENLSSAPGQIKSRFYGFYNRAILSIGTGLNINYSGTIALLPNGTAVAIQPGTIAIPANSTGFVYINASGQIAYSTSYPSPAKVLGAVISGANSITQLTDLREQIIDVVAPTFFSESQQIPPGGEMSYAGASLPSGWLWEDGSAYEPSQYPALFAAIGYMYGQDVTRFKVPDRRGRMPVGAGQGTGLTNRPLASTGGTEAEQLTIAQIPRHNHGVSEDAHGHPIFDNGHTHDPNDPGHYHETDEQPHSHGFSDVGAAAGGYAGIQGNTVNVFEWWNTTLIQAVRTGLRVLTSGTGITIRSAKTGISLSAARTNLTIQNNGGDGAHNNMPPYLTSNWIIKT